jgi:uncharacterized protein YbjT (DUF2867 family)
MRILLTGASGSVGSQLLPRLLCDGHLVRALARDPARVKVAGSMSDSLEASTRAGVRAGARIDGQKVQVLTGDVLSGEGLAQALRGIEVAYYLIHSMERPPTDGDRRDVTGGRATPFPERERIAAENFAAAASAAGVRRIVYLGGPTASWTANSERTGRRRADERTGERLGERAGKRGSKRTGSRDAGEEEVLSPHLSSREAVERILRGAVPDTVTLRASIVIGTRSRSLRFLVRIVERMPVLALPAWRSYRTRPIDARDVTDMLATAATVTAVAGRSLDVGGPDILSYGEMIQRIAELMLLGRPSVGLGVSATPLVAPLAAALAGEDPELVGALMESLRGDLLPGGPTGDAHLRAARLLGVDLHSFDSAVERSLREWEAVEELAAR